MGLDMYAYRARECTPEEIASVDGANVDSIAEDIYWILDDSIEREPELVKDLEPYWKSATVEMLVVNLNEIMRDIGISDPCNWHVSVGKYSYGKTTYIFRNKANEKQEVTLTEDEVRYYVFPVKKTCKVLHLTEVAYWRKDYELSYKLGEIRTIDNCGYYAANREMRELMIRHGANIDIHDPDILYHEWY